MKYTVSIADKAYEVEVEDVHARPIIAHVDGERFEVHLENMNKPVGTKETKEFKFQEARTSPPGQSGNLNELTAPLPGTIVELFVKKGEAIETGHVVMVIEAMKMKNSIRSTRSGKVSDVLVAVGQTVAHKQALVRFE
jgi:glutaconyl-CoA/methylmalonyl-CoA decarboxylase subunit gamma